MKTVSKMFFGLAAIAVASIFTSCDKERSGATGWAYNDEKNGGFERQDYVEQETGPGLVLVEGGTFTMGRVEDDLTSHGTIFHAVLPYRRSTWMKPR